MLKVSHFTLIILSGLVWLAVGCFLLPLGLNFVVESILKENNTVSLPILNFLAPYTGGLEQAALIWIGFALLVGFLKGRTVFAKSVKRSVNRILELPSWRPPVPRRRARCARRVRTASPGATIRRCPPR